MQIGDSVTYKGRSYTAVGFTPISVKPFRVELLDDETAKSFWIEWPPEEDVERAALRLASEEGPAQ